MLPALLFVILGFVLLIWSADRFVAATSALAERAGVSKLLVGLTLVAFGSSLPEILVSVIAAYHGSTELAVGNAVGSNITNVGLVLGVTALVTPITVHRSLLKREMPLLLFVMIISALLLWDQHLSRLDSALLATGCLLFVFRLMMMGRQERTAAKDEPSDPSTLMSPVRASLWTLGGLLIMPCSSSLVVNGATTIAHLLNISDFVIGVTVVAVGTSLPEMAASLISALKGEHDIALGNVLGSNIFNLLAVLGFSGLVRPANLHPSILWRDFATMFLLTVALVIASYQHRTPSDNTGDSETVLTRYHGICFLTMYITYLSLLLYMPE